MAQTDIYTKPPVRISETEFDALYALAMAITPSQPKAAGILLGELERAEMYDARSLPANTITMNTAVEFRDEISGEVRAVELVFPHRADIDTNKISVATPVGAALIGLTVGDTIEYPQQNGTQRPLHILKVTPPY